MKSYWNYLPDELKFHIYVIRLQIYVRKFLKKLYKKKFIQYLEMKAIREGINDPWWDYYDPIYGHSLV